MNLAPSPRPLRIALVTDFALPRLGGIEVHLDELAGVLASRGHWPTIVTTTPGAGSATRAYAVDRLDVTVLPGAGIAFPGGLVRRLEAVLRSGRYDVVHAHLSIVSPLGFAAIRAARRLGMPCVVTVHSMVAGVAPAVWLMDQRAGLAQWPFVVSAVSETAARQIRRAVAGLPVRRLPNGIHTRFWHGAGTEAADDAMTFVCAMRLTPRKRPLALLAAARAAQQRLGGRRRLRLIYAGEGRSGAKLRRRCEADRSIDVEILPRLSHEELRALYRRAHAFVLPTKHEAFGRAALEARCAGLPVVAMAMGGVGEYIRHGESGLLARDDDELARHLASLADEDALRRRLAGADPGLEPYDWASIILAHEHAYRDALAMLGQPPHTPGGISIALGERDQRGEMSGAGHASPEYGTPSRARMGL